MRRSHEQHDGYHYNGDSVSSIDEYLERVTRLQRTPSVITESPDVPIAHKPHHQSSHHAERYGDHQKPFFHANRHHHAPEMHKKVHFVEHEKISEIDRDGHSKVHEEAIDVEAEGFIKQKHRKFESCSTLKGY